MPILSQLTITQANRTIDQSSEAGKRMRLVKAIDQQLKAASMLPQSYHPTRSKWVTNADSGQRELQEVPVRFTPWWWSDETGKMFLGVRYGNKWLELKPKKTAIELSNPEALQETLEKLKAAVLEGELDALLKAAGDARKKQFSKK